MEGETVEHVYIIKEGIFSVYKHVVCDKLPEVLENEPPLFK